ncbi:hypothetical protein FRB90_001916 [Tulasnella sp. 427]|nr:hypothetical protein FRB90_001916 [Tulasnella sp. 427]
MPTLRALNAYKGESRQFKYLSSKIHVYPKDLEGTKLARPKYLHMCTIAERATRALNEIDEIGEWQPILVYEPFEGACTPAEYPKLAAILNKIDILRCLNLANYSKLFNLSTLSLPLPLSPNAEEALRMLEIPLPVTKDKVEEAATAFVKAGVKSCVIIRSAGLGAYALETRPGARGFWVPAFWTTTDAERIVDVTGAGNSFLGGLAAGLAKSGGDLKEGVVLTSPFRMLYASVSASFTIEQCGLPTVTRTSSSAKELWNGDDPYRRLADLRNRTVTSDE